MKNPIDKMNDYEKMIAAMEIFNKYEDGDSYIGAFHDEIRVGVPSEAPSEEDQTTLEQLGWFAQDDSWMTFT
jgi:hypothetical protein